VAPDGFLGSSDHLRPALLIAAWFQPLVSAVAACNRRLCCITWSVHRSCLRHLLHNLHLASHKHQSCYCDQMKWSTGTPCALRN
jgi:hypothetical protein